MSEKTNLEKASLLCNLLLVVLYSFLLGFIFCDWVKYKDN